MTLPRRNDRNANLSRHARRVRPQRDGQVCLKRFDSAETSTTVLRFPAGRLVTDGVEACALPQAFNVVGIRDQGQGGFSGVGRLKPGVTAADAEKDLLRAQQPIWDARDRERIV